MLFNSYTFAVFFIILYALFLRLGHKGQNRLLLAGSYIFYGWWDWRFLSLILISTVVDYFCGQKISQSEKKDDKLAFVYLSVATNLSLLGFFKYFNFFAASLVAATARFGLDLNPVTLNIVLPVGISFYTFQTMSYSIDVYRGQVKATDKFFDFALFVAFFPQLIAGPIERAKHLLPQILKPRKLSVEQFSEGCWLFFWGLFQKVMIADRMAMIVDPIFKNPNPDGASVLLGVYAFAFQIFCDFAGYSNMARGLAKMMGFEIMVNFWAPYFSGNPSEFWRRWHISLSTWLRDYLYVPLGGNRGGNLKTLRNLMLTMLLGGLWHGAAWNFVLWGAFHGLLLVTYRLITPSVNKLVDGVDGFALWLLNFLNRVFFFHLICYGWLLFRVESLEQIGVMSSALFGHFNTAAFLAQPEALTFALLAAPLLAMQLFQVRRNNFSAIFELKPVLRWALYLVIFHVMTALGAQTGQQFIYFQF